MVGRCSLERRSFSVCCLYSFVVDVGGISVVLCGCYDFPSWPLQFDLVFVDRVYLSWTACHFCEVGPVGEVPLWRKFHHSFHQGPRVIHITRVREPSMYHNSVV